MDVERPLDRYQTVVIDPARLTAARETAGHTMSSLARLAGVSQATVSRLERGDSPPSVATATRLARALNVTLDDLTPKADKT